QDACMVQHDGQSGRGPAVPVRPPAGTCHRAGVARGRHVPGVERALQPRPVAEGDGRSRPRRRLVRPPAPPRGRGAAVGPPVGGPPPRLPLAGLAGRPGRGRPAGLPLDALLRLRRLHRLRYRARRRLDDAAGGRQPGHRPGPVNRRPGHQRARRAALVGPDGSPAVSDAPGPRAADRREAPGPAPRLRIRYSKQGKVRFTSHRDVARIWERALRRAQIPIAYTEGFAPRPKLSFGLALSTGYEPLGEYLDVALRVPLGQVAVEQVPALLAPALPAGMEVQSVAPLPPGAPSLQQVVTSCTWHIEVGDLGPPVVAAGVARALEAAELPLT